MRSKYLNLILIVVFVLLLSCAFQPDNVQEQPEVVFSESKLDTVEQDVVYCTADDGTELRMDIYYPETAGTPWPVMMQVHGGGWTSGSKGDGDLLKGFTQLGVLGVDIDYRLAPDAIFPDFIVDVKCAVRYLRANAEGYNIDSERFLAVGGSAGGHLVSLLGTTGSSGEFNSGQYLDQPSHVSAVVALSAPTRLEDMLCWEPWLRALAVEGFGATEKCGDPDLMLQIASPVHYVDSGDPPHLILAGTADEVVPYEQSILLHEALQAAGVESQMLIVEGGDHALNVENHPEEGERVLQALVEFTLKHLELERPDWLEEWE